MPRLSTHVLDASRGCPAAGVRIRLYTCHDDARRLVATAHTNADGRTADPLLSADALPTGVYELVFSAGEYFRAAAISLPHPPFLDEVVVRFSLLDAAANYHVPLLLSPYSYTTYRGS